MSAGDAVILASRVSHFYGEGALRKQILHEVDLEVDRGEILIMTGPSGSGKTTLLTLIGALRSAQEGSLHVLGRELRGAPPRALREVRRQIGYIFQAHNLLASLTAEENVEMPLALLPLSAAERRARARAALDAVGLGHRRGHLPGQLSGGQKQRVAIARALAPEPRIILADEPTASLDKQSGRDVVDLMNRLAREQGCAVLLVTHDNRILDIADRIVHLEDGYLQSFTAAVTTSAERMLDALVRTTSASDLADTLRDLPDEQFQTLFQQTTSEFQRFLSVMRLAGSEAFETMLDQVLRGFTLKIGRLLGAERATLFVADFERGELWSRVAAEHREIRMPMGTGVAGRVVDTGEAMNVPDAYAEPLFNRRVDEQTGYRTRSILCAPLRNAQGGVFAAVQLLNKTTGRPFDARDEARLQEFADRMGAVLEAWAEMYGRRAA